MTAYLLYGYDLGDMDSAAWHKEQAAGHGRILENDFDSAYPWLLNEDGDWDRDVPNLVAAQALKAWYTPDDLAEIFYPWTFLEEQKGLSVYRVGWEDKQHMVLAMKGAPKVDEGDPIMAVTDLHLPNYIRVRLRQAWQALGLAGEVKEPGWFLATLSG